MDESKLLYQQMYDYLVTLINDHRDQAGYKLPSENQLAVKFKASRVSARHALDLLEQEKQIFRQRGRGSFIASQVQQTAATVQSRLPDDTEDSVALIVPFISTMFMSEIINGIDETLRAHRLHCIIFLTDNDQSKEVQYLHQAQNRFKGILVFPGAYARYHEEILRLVINHFPLVQIDRYLPGLNLSYVACEHEDATYRAVRFLAEKGHRRIGFVGHRLSHASSVTERLRGFDRATQEIDHSYPSYFKLNVPDTLDRFDELFTAYFEKARPDAIISSSHLHAPAVMRLLKEMGEADRVELMLYDNEFAIAQPFMNYHPYVIDQQPRLIGQRAASLLCRLIDGQTKPVNDLIKANIIQV